MDDIIQWAMSDKEALEHYSVLFQRLVKVGMQLKLSKCIFFAREIEILGHHETQEGRTPISRGVEAILSMPTPTNTSTVKRFLGLCGYFKDFIPCMSTRRQALRSLLKKGVSFQWTEETAREFQDLTQAITGPDVLLFHPDWNAPFELHVDATKLGCGAMLAQKKDGVLSPVRFASRAFTSAELRWTTMHQKLLAVKWGLEQFRSYIVGRRVKVVTDHANLKWLTTMAPQRTKVARWCMIIAEFDFFIDHRKGERNIAPDGLSRHPTTENIPDDNVVIPPENAVIAFIIIATSVDVPNRTPELVHGTFNNSMAYLYNACLMPETYDFDPVCLATAPKRVKRAKKARALFNDVFLQYGFPVVLQSDQGGEWLNAVLRLLTKHLSIRHSVTTSYRPRLNGSTERVHRWLNAAVGIYCEKYQERWEEFLQPAVYAHNVLVSNPWYRSN